MRSIMKSAIAAALLIALPAHSYSLSAVPADIDVGGLDGFITEATKEGSPASEALWVQGVLGDVTINWTVSVHDVSYSAVIGETNIFAFELALDPEYFIVKNSNRMALFSNIASLDWGVFDAGNFSSGLNIPSDLWEISHVTSLDGNGGTIKENPVPEGPLTLLLGMGLIGLGISKKYKI